MQDNASDALFGRVINNRFQLNVFIGRGGTAEVWEAFDYETSRRVAVKLLWPECAADATGYWVERLETEAQVMQSSSHPSLPACFGWGYDEDTDRYYLAMERLFGHDLATEIERRGSLPAPRALRIVFSLCAAVEHLHRRGIIHRDLKPANVFLHRPPGGQETVKLLDFSLVKRKQGRRWTEPGTLVGTMLYLAPEQVSYEDRSGIKTDLYALGTILYEMLSGRPPFRRQGDSALAPNDRYTRVLARLLREAPPPLPERVPRVVRRLVEETLALDPARRPKHVGAFAARCAVALKELERPAPRATATRLALPSPARLRRLLASLLAALTIFNLRARIDAVFWEGAGGLADSPGPVSAAPPRASSSSRAATAKPRLGKQKKRKEKKKKKKEGE